jgi:hypothetical protein
MENKTFKFNIVAFISAFAIGILFVYLSSPKQKIIIKYPTPYNSNKIVYKNENDMCYKYDVEEIKCTDKAIDQPII